MHGNHLEITDEVLKKLEKLVGNAFFSSKREFHRYVKIHILDCGFTWFSNGFTELEENIEDRSKHFSEQKEQFFRVCFRVLYEPLNTIKTRFYLGVLESEDLSKMQKFLEMYDPEIKAKTRFKYRC